jgi:hypothetical protein
VQDGEGGEAEYLPGEREAAEHGAFLIGGVAEGDADDL